jgi:hypothetical protein
VIESISGPDWNSYSALFPKPPITADRSGDWAHSLATEIVSLRTILEESLHDLFTASKFLMDTPEGERWENLAKLENLMEKKLHAWGYRSRSRALRSDFHLPSQFQKIILAGVTEMPACLAKALSSFSGHLTVLIAAPDSEKEHVSDLGIPLETWTQRDLPESAKVSVCADPASQAEAAFMAIASAGLEAHEPVFFPRTAGQRFTRPHAHRSRRFCVGYNHGSAGSPSPAPATSPPCYPSRNRLISLLEIVRVS